MKISLGISREKSDVVISIYSEGGGMTTINLSPAQTRQFAGKLIEAIDASPYTDVLPIVDIWKAQ